MKPALPSPHAGYENHGAFGKSIDMDIKKATLENGIYTVDVDISVAEWRHLLEDREIFKKEYISLFNLFLAEPGHASTCRIIGEKSFLSAQMVSDTISEFGKAVQKKLNRFRVIGTDYAPTYWLIPMYGKDTGKGLYWAVRPELAQAMASPVEAPQPVFIHENSSEITNPFPDGQTETINNPIKQTIKAEPQTTKPLTEKELNKILFAPIITAQPQTIALASNANKEMAPVQLDQPEISVVALTEDNHIDETETHRPPEDCTTAKVDSGTRTQSKAYDRQVATEERSISGNETPLKQGDAFLQSLYKQALDEVNWIFYKWYPKYKRQVKKYRQEDLEGEEWNIAVLAELFSGTGLNNAYEDEELYVSEEELSVLLGGFEHIQNACLKFVKTKSISENEYDYIHDYLIDSLGIEQQQIPNVLIAGLLPGVVTTMTDYQSFKKIAIGLQFKCTDYPKITGNWLTDNQCFIQYCNEHIEFNEPWHVSLFIWYIKHYLEEEAGKKRREREEKLRQEYICLLLSHKNVIIKGVTGTRKVELAKAIAAEMDAEAAYLPLYASYSYADFVENIKSDGDTTRLHDGTLKAFCKKAAVNYADSHKSARELHLQELMSVGLSAFIKEIENVISEKITYPLYGYKNAEIGSIVEINDNHFTVKTSNGNLLKLPIDKFLTRFKNYDEFKTSPYSFEKIIENFSDITHRDYYLAFLNAFDIYFRDNKIDVPKVNPVKEKKFLLILDKVSNIDMANLFKETSMVLAPHHRGEKGRIRTRHNELVPKSDPFHDGFYIPENVYIILLLDTLKDYSAPLEFSISKNFAWKTIKIGERLTVWDDTFDGNQLEALNRMSTVNRLINHAEGFGEAYKIGPVYFLRIKDYGGDFEALWFNYLREILRKHFGSKPDAEQLLMQLESAYLKTGHTEVNMENTTDENDYLFSLD